MKGKYKMGKKKKKKKVYRVKDWDNSATCLSA